jgi:Leucine-rich repeat (LRR) protein
VPAALRHAASVEQLDLSNNRISELPDWLDRLPRLNQVFATGNPLQRVQCVRPRVILALPQVSALSQLGPPAHLLFVCG